MPTGAIISNWEQNQIIFIHINYKHAKGDLPRMLTPTNKLRMTLVKVVKR